MWASGRHGRLRLQQFHPGRFGLFKLRGGGFPYIVAEINEPDHSKSPNMKAGYRAIEKALAGPEGNKPPPRQHGQTARWFVKFLK